MCIKVHTMVMAKLVSRLTIQNRWVVVVALLFKLSALFTNRDLIRCPLPSGLQLRSLLPLGVDTNHTAQRPSKADKAVIEADPAEVRQRHSQVAQVAEQLELANGAFSAQRVSIFVQVKKSKCKVLTYSVMRLLSTTPSPSLRSMRASRCLSLTRVYVCAATLKSRPTAQQR